MISVLHTLPLNFLSNELLKMSIALPNILKKKPNIKNKKARKIRENYKEKDQCAHVEGGSHCHMH